MRIAFIIAHTRNNVAVLFGTLKVQSFMVKIAFGKKKIQGRTSIVDGVN